MQRIPVSTAPPEPHGTMSASAAWTSIDKGELVHSHTPEGDRHIGLEYMSSSNPPPQKKKKSHLIGTLDIIGYLAMDFQIVKD